MYALSNRKYVNRHLDYGASYCSCNTHILNNQISYHQKSSAHHKCLLLFTITCMLGIQDAFPAPSHTETAEEGPRYVEGVLWAGSICTRVLSSLSEGGSSPTAPLSDSSDMCCTPAPSWQQSGRAPSPPWLELDLWEELGELVGLSWTAVVSCSVCSLVSISNAAVPIRISPHFSPPLALRGRWDGGLLLTTQQVVKNARAINKRRGPMMMGGFPVGTKVPKAKAPTKVMLMPASMMHSPQAQHRAGDGRLWGRRARCWGTLLEAESLGVFSVSTMSHWEGVWWDTEKLELRQLITELITEMKARKLKRREYEV